MFSNVAGSDDYLSHSVMDKAGVWGTDVEVFAFASMVNTTVYVYCPVGESYQWLPYRPVRDVQPNVQVSAPCKLAEPSGFHEMSGSQFIVGRIWIIPGGPTLTAGKRNETQTRWIRRKRSPKARLF